MEPKIDLIQSLRESILNDVFKDFEETRQKWIRWLLEPIVYPSATRFAKIAALFDMYVENFGFREGMRHILPNFASDLNVRGEAYVPDGGPLLVLSNHPGTFDSLAITAALPRDDLSIIAYGFPLLQKLPEASRHLIFASNDNNSRFSAIRLAIRHLREGGSLLIFPAGRVEPDPEVLPGAIEKIEDWSPSIEMFLRKVPDLQVMITIVSGVLSPRFMNSPLIRFWKDRHDPQTVAETIQTAIQMIFPKRVHLIPSVSFSPILVQNELADQQEDTFASIIKRTRQAMQEHWDWLKRGNELPT